MDVIYNQEKWSNIKHEMIPLVSLHWEECNKSGKEPFDLDEKQYDNLCSTGNFIIITARYKEKLIGYVASLIFPNINLKNVLTSFEMGWYVSLEFRKTRVGVLLRSKTEAALKDLNVKIMDAAIPCDGRLDKLMNNLGWSKSEVHYKKYIGDN